MILPSSNVNHGNHSSILTSVLGISIMPLSCGDSKSLLVYLMAVKGDDPRPFAPSQFAVWSTEIRRDGCHTPVHVRNRLILVIR